MRAKSEEWDIITRSIQTLPSVILSLALFVSLEPSSVLAGRGVGSYAAQLPVVPHHSLDEICRIIECFILGLM